MGARPIRVIVAEDSPTVRALLVEILTSDPGITVVGEARNGAEAVDLTALARPDVVTMDVQMPVMDGFEATREIMTRTPTPIVIVSSSTYGKAVDRALDATAAGALTIIEKPEHPHSPQYARRSEQLRSMVKAMAQVKVVRRWAPARASGALPLISARRPAPDGARVRLVAMAASTGGPAAIQRILARLPAEFPAPVLVVQHIADGFVGGLADWLSTATRLRVKVAEEREPLLPRTVYIAPDRRHLGVGEGGRVMLSDAPPIEGFRPSGTFLFASAARQCGPALAAVILTGMGSDGVEGLRAVHASGGHVLAQNAESSVVYGMPQEALRAGVVSAVLPLEQIAERLVAAAGA